MSCHKGHGGRRIEEPWPNSRYVFYFVCLFWFWTLLRVASKDRAAPGHLFCLLFIRGLCACSRFAGDRSVLSTVRGALQGLCFDL